MEIVLPKEATTASGNILLRHCVYGAEMASSSNDVIVHERDYRVLIVDDDMVDRELYCRSLAKLTSGGCDITCAADGVAGLAALRAAQFDCLLLDYHLPDMSGFEFLDAAAVESQQPFAVLLLTGQGNELIAVEAMKRGVQDYLPKGRVNADTLCKAVNTAVTQAELQKRLADSLSELTEANSNLNAEVRNRAAAETELRAAKTDLETLATNLAEARDRAEQANRAKSQFLAGISHELRTPLNGILGCAHLLLMEGGLNVTQAARVDAMLATGKHLLEMITSVLDISAIEAGRVELHPVELDVRAFAAECLDLVRSMTEAKGLALSITLMPGVRPDLMADPTRLRQILLNLLGNATKFTTQGKVELCLRAVADRSALQFEVVDTGCGISAEHRHRLFQDFDRLEIEATGNVEGAGLGLALSARLATLMGGRLGHHDNPGGGSVFWLELPLGTSAAPMAPGSDVEDSETGLPLNRELHLLVVDDNLLNREIASFFLRAAGHQVLCVEGGAEAVEAAAGADFDVILMDVRMPKMDGLEATRRIRGLEGIRGRVPIVALTAQAFTDQIEACYEAGMDAYLAKPLHPETLLVAVRRAIAPGRLLGERSACPGERPCLCPL